MSEQDGWIVPTSDIVTWLYYIMNSSDSCLEISLETGIHIMFFGFAALLSTYM